MTLEDCKQEEKRCPWDCEMFVRECPLKEDN